MPVRLNVKGPGPFIRDHLLEISDGRDFVGSMYHAYKIHLRGGGVDKLPCRPTFHSYIWKLKETGAIVFDGADPVSFTEDPPELLPAGYQPACGMPAPRHFYRIVDSGHPAFERPEAVWREQRGLPAPVARPRVPVIERALLVPAPLVAIPEFQLPPRASRRGAQRLISHLELLQELGVDEPDVQEEVDRLATALEAWPDVPDIMEALDSLDIPGAIDALGEGFPATVRLTPADRLVREGRTFRARIAALRMRPDLGELASLEEDMLDYFDRTLDAAERARGDQRDRLVALSTRLEGSAEGFDQARQALSLGDLDAYEAAMDVLAACCPPEPGETT